MAPKVTIWSLNLNDGTGCSLLALSSKASAVFRRVSLSLSFSSTTLRVSDCPQKNEPTNELRSKKPKVGVARSSISHPIPRTGKQILAVVKNLSSLCRARPSLFRSVLVHLPSQSVSPSKVVSD